MKKLFMLALILCLFAPIGIAQVLSVASPAQSNGQTADDGSMITIGPATIGSGGSQTRGSLTTLFASNNQFAGNTFDITPAIEIEIDAIEINAINAGNIGNVTVYYKTGTSVGFESNPGAWSILATGPTDTIQGINLPTLFDMRGNGVKFQATQLYGIYVHLDYVAGVTTLCYTNGPPTVYSNADLSLTTQNGMGSPAFGSPFIGRMWNGTIYYNGGYVPPTLKIDNDHVKTWVGGIINFNLEATVANAGRFFVLFGSVTGNSPGTALPKSGPNLPINWDGLTNLLLNTPYPTFMGNLDSNGSATAQMIVAPFDPPNDFTMTFAWALNGPPWDFASNYVEVFMEDKVPGYAYDDGSCENLLAWTSGGEIAWMHYFDSGTTDTIAEVGTAFGSTTYPGYNPGNGTPATVYIWDDPTNDNDPTDAILLQSLGVTVVNVDTDMINYFTLPSAQTVTGGFWVGAMQPHLAGQFVCPIDMDTTPYNGEARYAGVPAGIFDPNVIPNNTVGDYLKYWLLRAK